MPGCGRPCTWEIVKRIPVNARDASNQQLSRSAQSKFLHLFCTETRHANLRTPDGQLSDIFDFADPLRPFLYWPMIPIQRESVQCAYIDIVEHAKIFHALNEFW